VAMQPGTASGPARTTLVLGDLFDSGGDFLVVPCSTGGSLSATFRIRLDGMQVALTTDHLKAGQVIPVSVERGHSSARMVLFAAVVRSEGTTPEVVEAAARQAGEHASAGSVTVFPLLGAGAGALPPEESVRAMVAGFFDAAPADAKMRISVLSEALYDQLLPMVSGDVEPAGLALSATMRRVVATLEAKDAVPATALVVEILSRHAEYGDGKGRPTGLGEHEDPVRKPVHAWLADVRALFDPAAAPALHGRLVIIGLSLLAPGLRDELDEGGFLDRLVKELDMPLSRLLTAEGLKSPASPRDEGVPTHTDNPAMVDELGRKGFARILARRIRDVRVEECRNAQQRLKAAADQRGGAFLVHLHAPWGAGKTSLLNFLAAELRERQPDGDLEPWVVVNFNAWRHQRIAPPWWWLMTTMYGEAVRELRRFDRWRAARLHLHEWWWRFKGGWPGYLALLLGAGVLVWAWQTGFLGAMRDKHLFSADTLKGIVITAAAIVTPALTLWGLVRAVSRWLFATSARGARRFIDNTNDPMRMVHEHLRDLVRWIHHDVVVLVDDLDRCKSPYVVELLEGIQTLFRDVPVTYVVAADRDWLADSYAAEYGNFGNLIQEPGRPIGYLFLEKTFQISAGLPSAGPRLDTYWGRLLRSSDLPSEGELDEARTAAKVELSDMHSKDARLLVAAHPGTTAAQVQARLETVAVEMASDRAAQSHSHTLEPFRTLLGRDPNPRMMKRLVNAYGIARGVETLHGYNLEDDHVHEQETALWTILNLRWPSLGAHLARHPEHVEAIGNGNAPPEVPGNLRPLFADRDVIGVVRGEAERVVAHLDKDRLGAIVRR
jgi:hypothetical protein